MKRIRVGGDARDKLFKGLEILTNMVKISLGPRGRIVIMKRLNGKPQPTKDGVSIAREVADEDSEIQMGIELARGTAELVDSQAGDGTSTATVLMYNMALAARKLIDNNSNVAKISNYLKYIGGILEVELDSRATKVTSKQQLINVATISANNDSAIGELVGSEVFDVGLDGIVNPEEVEEPKTYAVRSEGYQINRGLMTESFINNHKTKECVLDDPLILVLEEQMVSSAKYYDMFQEVSDNGKELLIVAQDITGEAMGTLITNRIKGSLMSCPIITPGFKDTKMDNLGDLASITGATIVPKGGEVSMSVLGNAVKAIIDKDNTSIFIKEENIPAINDRIELIKAQLEIETDDFKQRQLIKRVSQLGSKSSIIKVGGNSPEERKEKYDRVVDAVNASKSALSEGMLPGGGVALNSLTMFLEELKTDDSEYNIAIDILINSIESPFNQILVNAGLDPVLINDNIIKKNHIDFGFNVKTSSIENLIESGVVDSAKTVKSALKASISIVSTILMTEGTIVEEQDMNFM